MKTSVVTIALGIVLGVVMLAALAGAAYVGMNYLEARATLATAREPVADPQASERKLAELKALTDSLDKSLKGADETLKTSPYFGGK